MNNADIPAWIAKSPLLASAYALAQAAHRSERRVSDGRLFIDAVGLLHDSVERGILSESKLCSEMGDRIGSLVMALSEDPALEPFDLRKAALREQVIAAGDEAVTVFAADKLSCIKGLRRGLEADAKAVETRTRVGGANLLDHYRESVETVASADPDSPFLPALRSELGRLADEWSARVEAEPSE